MIKYIQYFTFLVWNFESNINFVKTRIVVASKKKKVKKKKIVIGKLYKLRAANKINHYIVSKEKEKWKQSICEFNQTPVILALNRIRICLWEGVGAFELQQVTFTRYAILLLLLVLILKYSGYIRK